MAQETTSKGTYKRVPPYSKAQIDALGEIIETADVSGISHRSMNTIRRQVRKGAIPAVKVGGKLAYSKAAILRIFGLDEAKGVSE